MLNVEHAPGCRQSHTTSLIISSSSSLLVRFCGLITVSGWGEVAPAAGVSGTGTGSPPGLRVLEVSLVTV